jgi:SAM-dependent methyltransferase
MSSADTAKFRTDPDNPPNPRQLKAAQKALSGLLFERGTHTEVRGTKSADPSTFRRTTLTAMFSSQVLNPRAVELYNAIGERFGWLVSRANAATLASAADEARREAHAAAPEVFILDDPAELAERAKVRAAADEARALEQDKARETWRGILDKRPADAAALIVAELAEDRSDPMTDYFGHVTVRRVAIGWRTGQREDFRQLRRAAGAWPDTAHLGPDAPADVEHRENYSKGAGNYLKAGFRDSDGWSVRSRSIPSSLEGHLEVLEDCIPEPGPAPAGTAPGDSNLGRASASGASVSERENKRGRFFLVELTERVDRATFESLRVSAKAAGGWYSRAWRGCPGGFGFSDRLSAEDWIAFNLDPGTSPAEDCARGLEPGTSPAAPEPGPVDRMRAVWGLPPDEASDCRHSDEGADFWNGDPGALHVPVGEVTMAHLAAYLRLASQVGEVREFANGSLLVRREDSSGFYVLDDNGGEVNVRPLQGQRESDTGPGLDSIPTRWIGEWFDAWEVVRAVLDSMDRQGRGKGTRGGDVVFPLPPDEPEPDEGPAPAPVPTDSPAGRARALEAERLDALAEGFCVSGARLWSALIRSRRGVYGQRADADMLERTQEGLRALAEALRRNELPGELASFLSRTKVDALANGHKPPLRAATALAGLVQRYGLSGGTRRADENARHEQARELDALRWQKRPGFFPTPAPLAERVAELLELDGTHDVLEPSAGMGHLAEALRDAGLGTLTLVELAADLVEYLHGRGLGLVLSGDFLDWNGEGLRTFDRIGMNPPFERGAARKHVEHAARMLRPGGRLVAVYPAGQDLPAVNGCDVTTEPVEDGAFAGRDAFKRTGVRVQLVILERGEVA